MGRPVYTHELNDPDFTWLINSFRENNPHCVMIDTACMPVMLIREGTPLAVGTEAEPPPVPAAFEADDLEDADIDAIEHK